MVAEAMLPAPHARAVVAAALLLMRDARRATDEGRFEAEILPGDTVAIIPAVAGG